MAKAGNGEVGISPPLIIEHRADRFQRFLSSVVALLLVGAMFFIAARVDFGVAQSTRAANAAAQDGTILVDCTTPHHACYDQAKAGTGQALAQINVFVTAAAICARITPFTATDATFENCIIREAAAITENQQTNPGSPFYIPPSATTTTTTTTTTLPQRSRGTIRSEPAPTTTTTRPPPMTTTTNPPPPSTTTTTQPKCPHIHIGSVCA